MPDLSSAHVFWHSNKATTKHSFKTSFCCQWTAENERGIFVAKGSTMSGTVVLEPASAFGVGFYRFSFSGGGNTTAAVLRPPNPLAVSWPPPNSPVAVDTAQAWQVKPCDYSAQLLVSSLAAAAGCSWTRDRLRWSQLELSRGKYAPPNR